MELVLRFRLQPSQSQTHSTLLDDNGKSVGTIPGRVLEKQLRISDSLYLLFLTDDVPFKEGLHVVLWKMGEGALEALDFAAAYHTGSLERLEILSDENVRFEFFPDLPVVLEIVPKSFRALRSSPSSIPVTSSRHPWQKKYLRIQPA